MSQEDGSHVVKLKNIHSKTKKEDIIKFFSDCKIKNGENGIHKIVNSNERFGKFYIELETDDDVAKALKKDNHFIGASTQKAEVTISDEEELKAAIDDFKKYVKIANFSLTDTSIADVIQFFKGLKVKRSDVFFLKNPVTKKTEILVRFETREMAEKALEKDKSILKRRSVRVLPSRRDIFKKAQENFVKKKNLSSGEKAGFTINLKGIASSRSYHTDCKHYYPQLDVLKNKKMTDESFEEGKVLSVGGNFGIRWAGINKIFDNMKKNDYSSSLSHVTFFRESNRSFHFYQSNLVSSRIDSRNGDDSYSAAEADTQLTSYNFIPIRLFGGSGFFSTLSFRPEKILAKQLFRIVLK